MLSSMRWKLGRTCFRLGLRLLGFDPETSVIFSADAGAPWPAAQLARWSVRAVMTNPEERPAAFALSVPCSAKDDLLRELDALPEKPT